jgi:succinoglycan biosynthesis transport protein ExoP
MIPAEQGTPAPPSVLEGAADGLASLLKAVRKNWAVVVACVLLGSGLALLVAKSQAPAYEAVSMLEITPHASQPLGDKGDSVYDIGAGLFWDPRDYYETQYRIITSDRVLATAARNLGLTNDFEFFGYVAAPPNPPTLEEAAAALRSRITVEPIKYSRLVNIKAEDVKPARARAMANAVAEAYIDENLQNALSATSDAVTWLNGQVDHLKQELDRDENALHEFKQRNDLPSTSINEASNMLRVEMQEYDTALTHTRTKRAELYARNEELSKIAADDPDEIPASELLASAFLQTLRSQYHDALKQRSELITGGKGAQHPLVLEAEQKVGETKASLLAEVKNIQHAVSRDLAVVEREESAEAAMFEATRKRAVDLNMKEIEYHRLDRTRDENEKLYGTLLERMKEADLARMMRANNIRIVDQAAEPGAPVRPRVAMNVAVGLVIGLLLGVAIAALREQLDTSVKTPDDLEQKLSVTFLGLLPELGEDEAQQARRRRRRGGKPAADTGPIELALHTRPSSGLAEAARSIRTNLMFMNPDRPYRKLLVTSSAPSEGKTTVACSIAIAMAQGGQRVCIVDCDLRRPRLHRIFGRAGDAGLTNLLMGDATLDEVSKPTDIANLWSIPAGPIPPNPADMLQSERFKRFMKDLAERFDRVVIDSPPAVAVTDSAIVSTLVDATVFVVRAFKTSKHLAAQGLRSLRDVDAPVVGAVLNAVNLNRHEYTYYYHYYYYKRNGYSSATPGDAAAEDVPAAPPH